MTLRSIVRTLVISSLAVLGAGLVPPAAPAAPAVSLPGGVSNDTCAGAVVMPGCGNASPGTSMPAFPVLSSVVEISGATTDGDPSPSCKPRKRTGGVWFAFTPHAAGKYSISSCQAVAPGTSVADTVIAVYTLNGVCYEQPPKAYKEVACGDNDGNCAGYEGQSTVKVDLDAFKNYYIVVYGTEASSTGTVQVSIDRVQKNVLADGDFEQGILGTDWYPTGDVTVLPTDPPPPCFTADAPEWGCYMACFSNTDFFGGEATNSLRSDLTSRQIVFDSQVDTIKVSFAVEFQTEQAQGSIGANDAFEARLITLAGTFPIIQIDSFGRTVPNDRLTVQGFTGYVPSPVGCTLVNGIDTRRLTVSWTKSLNTVLKNQIGRGPVYVEFTIAGQGSSGRTAIACVDNVQVKGVISQ